MTVYAIKAYGELGGGMAIVAANSESEAMELAAKKEASPWKVDYKNPIEIEIVPIKCGCEPRVLVSFEYGA